MGLPARYVFGSLLALPLHAGGVGEGHPSDAGATATAAYTRQHTHVVVSIAPDTTRKSLSADTTRRPALVPDTTTVPADEDHPTRKTTVWTVLAIAALTISTLLLYNVRSR
ncbi:hypothetical protein MTX78_23060 [Hymenobacter tibetensis]|uniref:Uncharacterized protein n=1 Tax=Hymenobacter tibetensis TaxID=497967 RepID=A0ABY4CZ12_9BACT|nr:hypothetical protein [Hymenobacter tibetensis]UOG74982.1 hypothetical protein MTX78_23060 [Hymenobacter tibetensis]